MQLRIDAKFRRSERIFSPLTLICVTLLTIGATVAWARINDAQNRQQVKLEQLGQALFNDETLSQNGQVSCATCHDPKRSFTDGRPTSVALGRGTRNAPSLEDVARLRVLMWDGRHSRLEDQVLEPFTNPLEHGLSSVDELVARVNASAELKPLISQACLVPADSSCLRTALVSYVSTLSSPTTNFDRFLETGDDALISPSARRGWTLFTGSAGCSSCHAVQGSKPLFTDESFHPSGLRVSGLGAKLGAMAQQRLAEVLSNPKVATLGRFNVTGELSDLGHFRTPGLRGVQRTAPYMHDGSIATLEAALEYELYYRPRVDQRAILLTPLEKADLVSLLQSF